MKCDKCDKPAKVFLTQIIEGKVQKFALCDECAESGGVTDPSGFSLADLLMQVEGSGSGAAEVPVPSATDRGQSCPACGFTMEDLKKVRRFGCAQCYDVFRGAVKEMVSSLHQGMKHRGKFPAGMMAKHERDMRLRELEEKLTHAVDAEHYEEAASIRDEMDELKSEQAVKSES